MKINKKILIKKLEKYEIIAAKRVNIREIEGEFWRNLPKNNVPRVVTLLIEYFYRNKAVAERISWQCQYSSFLNLKGKKRVLQPTRICRKILKILGYFTSKSGNHVIILRFFSIFWYYFFSCFCRLLNNIKSKNQLLF